MIAASIALWLMAAAGSIGRIEGGLLFAAIVVYTLYLVRASRRETSAIRAEFSEEFGDGHGPLVIVGNLVMAAVGLAMLLLGAQWIVDGAVAFATSLGIPEVIVGLTIVAVGTSLPEIATSVLAGLRGHRDIAVGNVVGSCIFNILMVLGVSALVAPQPIAVSPSMLSVDLPLMVATALACLPILYTGQIVSRREGALLLTVYLLYLAYLVLLAMGAPLAVTFGQVLILGVVPVAGVALTLLAFRERAALRAAAATVGDAPAP